LDLIPTDRLPLLRDAMLRARKVLEPRDTRFRAAARLRQAIYRESQKLPVGSYTTSGGRRRKLGSRLNAEAAANGANFINRDVHRLTRREYAYREPGAAMDEERLFGNLLSSMPLTFNLFAPLKLDQGKAERFVHALCPDLAGKVTHIAFEHSPGRGDPAFTEDGTAFDAFISMRKPDGSRSFLAFEIKFAESMAENPARHRPRYDQLSATCGLFLDPAAATLRSPPIQQLWREHMLAQALLTRGLYDAGRFILIAPRLNADVQRSAADYQRHLAEPEDLAGFMNVTLEDVIDHLRTAGAETEADALHHRYVDFSSVHALV
jgi:hypothetical protein